MGLFLVALLIHVVMNLWLIVSAFTRSVLWGILVLLFSPLTAIAYGITNFRDAKLPFLLYLGSIVFAVVAFIMISPKEWQDVCERTAICVGVQPAEPDAHANPVPATPSQSGLTAPAVTPALPTPQQPGATATSAAPGNQPPLQVNLPAPAAKTATPASVPDTAPKSEAAPAKKENKDPMANFPAKHSLVQEDPLQVKKVEPPKLTETIKPSRVGKYLNRYLIVTLSNKVERRGLLKKVTNTTLTLERKWREKGSTSYSVNRSQIKKIQVLKEIPKDE